MKISHLHLLVVALGAVLYFVVPAAADRPHAEPPDPLERQWLAGTASTGLRIEPALLKQAVTSEPGNQLRFVVHLAQQADFGSVALLPDPLLQRQQIVSLLQTTAGRTQADLVSQLEAQQASGHVQAFHPFWIFNGIAVTGDAEALLILGTQPDVAMIREDRWQQRLEQPFLPEEGRTPTEDAAEWNIAKVGADLAWSALGITGAGVTVGIMDTGVDWQHPVLQTQYRGYKAGGLTLHEGNWFCTTEEAYRYPVDGNGHGTYVTGLAVGGTPSPESQSVRELPPQTAIGVAPGAQWIAVKMLDNSGYGYDSWIHAAFEWLMAPAGNTALAPDVVNGSWGKGDGKDESFRADLQALRAAGIVPVFAIGNDGPGVSSARSPASYPEAIAVGATNDLDQVAGFSSRGPSPWGEVKPEVAAPGVQVRSSLPGGTYGLSNGTSAAAPHVTGLVALLLQADPGLGVDQIEALLTSTAVPLGKHVPNYNTGWGRIDAYQAVAVTLQAGFVSGQVTRQPDGHPLSGAQVTVYDDLGQPRATVQAAAAGHYRIALPAGRYRLTAEAFGYAPSTESSVRIDPGGTTSLDLSLSPLPSGVLWGLIQDALTNGPVGAELSVPGTPARTTSDPDTGQYSLVLPVGDYTLETVRNGYRLQTKADLGIVADADTRVDVALTPAPTLLLMDSAGWYYGSQIRYYEQALEDRGYVYDEREIEDRSTDLPTVEDLTPYDIVIWSAPQDAPGLIGAADTISTYLSLGGNLFLSGQDVGFWDGGLNGGFWHTYYPKFLKVRAMRDDAGRSPVLGLAGDLLEGLSLPMNGPDSAENQISPDAIALLDRRTAAVLGRYAQEGDAATRSNGCRSYRAVYLAAGLEGLGNQDERAEVLDRALTWLDAPDPVVDVELYPAQQDGIWLGEGKQPITHTVELRNLGQQTDRFALELAPSAWPASVWDATFSRPISQSLTLGACQTQTLGLKVAVPPDANWNSGTTVTLTVQSLADPSRTAQATFRSKVPAPILLVDDHLWYDMLPQYQAALEANRLPYDVWQVAQTPHPELGSPALERLQRYPIVVWFTAYDWLRTLTADDEVRLAAYLEGGGRLLLSSQDYLYTSEFTNFATDYLGVAGYTESLTVTQAIGSISSPIGAPFDSLNLTYPFRNYSDALRPTVEPAAQVAFWGQHAQPVALLVPHPPWKSAFFAFPVEALPPPDMGAVIGQTVDWLSPLGDSALAVDRRSAAAGEQLAYTLTIRNTGPMPLPQVTLSNTIPFATEYVTGSLTGPAEYDSGSNRIVWNGALEPNQAVTVTYRLRLDALLPDGSTVRNTAQLQDGSGLFVDRTVTARIGSPDLSGSVKVASASMARLSQVLTYTLTLQNDGLRPARAHLIDPIPLHTAALPELASADSGTLTMTENALIWTGAISAGQSVAVLVPVVVDPAAAASYVLNRAQLDDGWGGMLPLEASTWVQAQAFLPLVLKIPSH